MYLSWLYCKNLLRTLGENTYALELLETMGSRESQLFESDVFQAALFMDQRINYRGSSLMTESNKQRAIVSKSLSIKLDIFLISKLSKHNLTSFVCYHNF